MNPQQAVLLMTEQGITQSQIVASLLERGVETTQETISRIGSGVIKNPRFVVGQAIVELATDQTKAA